MWFTLPAGKFTLLWITQGAFLVVATSFLSDLTLLAIGAGFTMCNSILTIYWTRHVNKKLPPGADTPHTMPPQPPVSSKMKLPKGSRDIPKPPDGEDF